MKIDVMLQNISDDKLETLKAEYFVRVYDADGECVDEFEATVKFCCGDLTHLFFDGNPSPDFYKKLEKEIWEDFKYLTKHA